jgi:Raf kinase inhibitor-like YbhB/YbcL family protein
MKLSSQSITEGKRIPKEFTADGIDKSPLLKWDDVPDGVKEFALIMDDPDAPTPKPWVHWVIYCIPSTTRELAEAIPRNSDHKGMKQGINSWPSNHVGYRGPAPPPGHGTHRYYFKLYALNQNLTLPSKASKEQVLKAIEGHVIAEAQLMGTYSR